MDPTPDQIAVAIRHYENLKKAKREYYRRQNPNPNPRGRPRKVVAASEEV